MFSVSLSNRSVNPFPPRRNPRAKPQTLPPLCSLPASAPLRLSSPLTSVFSTPLVVSLSLSLRRLSLSRRLLSLAPSPLSRAASPRSRRLCVSWPLLLRLKKVSPRTRSGAGASEIERRTESERLIGFRF